MQTSSDPGGAALAALRHRSLFLIFAGGVLYSTAGLFTRVLHFEAWTILAWRSLFAGLFMTLLVARETRRWNWRDYKLNGPHLWLMPLTSLGTICYIFALKLTTVADVMIVYSVTPLITALVAWGWAGERPSRRMLIASAAAVAGIAIMIGGGNPTVEHLGGIALALVMDLTAALTIVLARQRPGASMTPTNALGALLASLIAFGFAPGEPVSGSSLLTLAAFGIMTIGCAWSLIMAGARVVPSGEAALVGLADTVIGPLFVWMAFGENPGLAAFLGGSLIMGALLWNLWPDLRAILAQNSLSRSARI